MKRPNRGSGDNKRKLLNQDNSETNPFNVDSSCTSISNRVTSKTKSSATLAAPSRGNKSSVASSKMSTFNDARKNSKANISTTTSITNKIYKSSVSVSAVGGIKSSAATHTCKKLKSNEADKIDDGEMLSLLKKHNQRFAPAPAYEPPRHSVREVRFWEKQSGQVWSKLTAQERELANDEIAQLKKGGKMVTK